MAIGDPLIQPHSGSYRELIASCRAFTFFEAGSLVNVVGSYTLIVALSWIVFDLTGSAFVLGLTNFALMIPILFLALPAGALADRADRRLVILGAQSGGLLAAATLAFFAATGSLSIPLIIGVALIAGICNAISWPVWPVFVKDLVGPERLRPALAIDAARDNIGRIAGPAVAATLLTALGPNATLQIGCALVFALVAVLLVVRAKPAAPAPARPWIPALKQGLVYAWNDRNARLLLVGTGALGFCVLPYQGLMPAYVREVLRAGPAELGLLLGAAGVGAVAGAALVGGIRRPPSLRDACETTRAGGRHRLRRFRSHR